MEDNAQTKPVDNTPQPVIPNTNTTHEVLPEILEKEAHIRKSKKRFNTIVYTIIGTILFVIVLGILLSLVKYIQNKTKKSFETKEEVKVESNVDISKTWANYNSDELRLALKYPDNTKLMENKSYNGSIRNLEILYTPTNKENVNGDTLTEGFVFRITPLNLTKNTLDDIATVKRESFSIECGEGVQMSAVRPDLIYGLDARTFDVRNCSGDFKVTYTKRFGIYYEITQLYRGDLGFRQQYKSTTEEMIKSLVFNAEDVIQEEPFKKFENKQYDLSFTYPKELALDCCTLPEVTGTGTKKIVVLGAKESDTKYGVFGVFVTPNSDSASKNYITYEDYVNNQKANLISDYKIANNGNEPTIVQEQMNINGKYALRFKGLSWRGNDLIFIKVTDEKDKVARFYTLSVVNNIGTEFEDILQDILSTFSFEEL